MKQRRAPVPHAHKHLGQGACKAGKENQSLAACQGIIAPLRPHQTRGSYREERGTGQLPLKRWAEEGRERQKARGWLVPCAPPRLLIFRGHARLGRGRLWRASHRGNPWLSLRPGFDHLPAIQRPSFFIRSRRGWKGKGGVRPLVFPPPDVGGAWGLEVALIQPLWLAVRLF